MVIWRYNHDGWRLHSLYMALLIILLVFLGCDEGSYSSSGQGGSVDIQFSDRDNRNQKALPEEILPNLENSEAVPANPFFCPSITQTNCSTLAIETIQVLIYNAQNAIVAQSPQWRIEEGGGRLSGVPPGDGYRIVLLGRNENCGVIFRSERSGLRVTPGQTTDAGYFDINQFGFVPLAETMSYNYMELELEWNSVPGAVQYHLQIAQSGDNLFSDPIVDEYVTGTTFNTSEWTPPLVASGEYGWRVAAIDAYGNGGAWSLILYYKETIGNCLDNVVYLGID